VEDGTDFRSVGDFPLVDFGTQVTAEEIESPALASATVTEETLGANGQDESDNDDYQQTAKEPLVVLQEEIL
jgi:hypothetical protein